MNHIKLFQSTKLFVLVILALAKICLMYSGPYKVGRSVDTSHRISISNKGLEILNATIGKRP